MKESRSSLYIRIATMVVCFIVGAVVHFIYESYKVSVVVSAVVINVTALVLLYALLHMHYSRRRENITDKAIKALEGIKRGIKPPDPGQGGECAPILSAVSDLDNFIGERDKTRSEILSLLNSVASNMEIESMLNALLPKVIDTSGSNWGAFYIHNTATGKLEIKASLGFSKSVFGEFDVNIGESSIGMAARSKKIQIITNLTDESVYVTRTFLGKMRPSEVMAVPILKGEELVGVLALATASKGYTPAQQAMVAMIQEYIGAAVANSVAFEHHKRAMGELRFQNNLIRDLYDELQLKASGADNEAAATVKALCGAFGRAFAGEPAYVLTNLHGSALFASRPLSVIFTGADTDLTGADIFSFFADRELIAAFTSAGQGKSEFRLAVGGSVTVSAHAVKNIGGQTKYIILSLENY